MPWCLPLAHPLDVVTSLTKHDYIDVGIRELKAHLSEYVERVAAGEVVRVTDRGMPRAVLMPLPAADRVRQGLAEGWIIRVSREPPGPFAPVEPAPGTPGIAEILAADRGE